MGPSRPPLKIQPNKAKSLFCFLLFVQSFNCLYLWNKLSNFCGKPKKYPNRKCPPKNTQTKNKQKNNKNKNKQTNKQKQNKIIFFDFRLILLITHAHIRWKAFTCFNFPVCCCRRQKKKKKKSSMQINTAPSCPPLQNIASQTLVHIHKCNLKGGNTISK